MILILTINPLLELRYTLGKFNFNENNRNAASENVVGGKGINVSRQLKHLGVRSLNYTFVGQSFGRKVKELLDAEGLEYLGVKTQQDNRTASIIIEENTRQVSTVFSGNQLISPKEVEQFTERLDRMIGNCEILVCSGSSPCKETDGIFPYALSLADKYDKISILDSYGAHMEESIANKPTIIHNNISESELLSGSSLSGENEVIKYLESLYHKGVKQVFLTNGDKPIYASAFDFVYKVTPPNISQYDPTGSGDAFTAGIAYSHYNDLTFEQMLKLSTALGVSNAETSAVCKVELNTATNLSGNIFIEPLGKKMKLIDVTPTIY